MLYWFDALKATLLDMRVRLSAVKFVVDSVPLCVDIMLLIPPWSGVLMSLCFLTMFSPAVLNVFRSGVPSPWRYSDLTMSELLTPLSVFLLFLLGMGGFSLSLYCWKWVTILIFLCCYSSAKDGLTATSFRRFSSSGVRLGMLILLYVGFCCVMDGRVQFARVFFIKRCSSFISSCLGTTTRGCWR